MTSLALTELDKDAIMRQIAEFVMVAEKMDDPEIADALREVAVTIRYPDIPPAAAQKHIIKLQALSAKCAVSATWYKTYGKAGELEKFKKDMYYTLRDALDKLVDAIKYVIRGYGMT